MGVLHILMAISILQDSEDEKFGCKPKMKRGIWGKSSRKKSQSRPGSEIIASEITMCEEDRINLMKLVKSGEMTTEQALQRLARLVHVSTCHALRRMLLSFATRTYSADFVWAVHNNLLRQN